MTKKDEIIEKVTVIFSALHNTARSFEGTYDPHDIIIAQAFYLKSSLLAFDKTYNQKSSQAMHEMVVEIMANKPDDL